MSYTCLYHFQISINFPSSYCPDWFQPPSILRPVETTENETVEIVVTKLLLESYYDIVRKNVQDLVPKAIMHFLVSLFLLFNVCGFTSQLPLLSILTLFLFCLMCFRSTTQNGSFIAHLYRDFTGIQCPYSNWSTSIAYSVVRMKR